MAVETLLRPPMLSAYDPPETGEGSIDPFSLLTTYERLAERLHPWVTARMSRVRFVTAIAAGAHACAPFRDDIAADGVTPAWLVFEWHVAQALVMRPELLAEREPRRVPGRMKLTSLLQRGQALSQGTYLKTPTVFGYTGIFRRLALGLFITTDDLDLDDGGFELLRAWEADQGLEGFVSGESGRGAELRQAMRQAVADALAKGHVARPSRWEHWDTLARSFDPAAVGPRESAVLRERLTRLDMRPNPRDPEAVAMRRELVEALERSGQSIDDMAAEAAWLRSLHGSASAALRERLELIDAYERVATILEDAFGLVLHLGSARTSALGEQEFTSHARAQPLAAQLRPALTRLAELTAGTPWEPDVRPVLHAYSGAGGSAVELFRALLAHHEQVQKDKPPDGKRAWVERAGAGVVVRPQYRRDAPPPDDTSRYVHVFRTPSISGFLRDLGRLPR